MVVSRAVTLQRTRVRFPPAPHMNMSWSEVGSTLTRTRTGRCTRRCRGQSDLAARQPVAHVREARQRAEVRLVVHVERQLRVGVERIESRRRQFPMRPAITFIVVPMMAVPKRNESIAWRVTTRRIRESLMFVSETW
jgi:hypothetical protein